MSGETTVPGAGTQSTGAVGQAGDTTTGRLKGGSLGVTDIVFFVVAAAAPLAVMAGAAPLAFNLGGIGAPGAYVFSGVVYLLCAAGLTAFSQHVRSAGAFYAFIGKGLGRPAGAGSAIVALVSYALICFGFFGFLGFYAESSIKDLTGVDIHWSVFALTGAAVVGVLGYRQITVGARLLGVLMGLEVLILVVLAVAVLATEGAKNVSAEPFAPANVFNPTSGGMFVLALGAFLGFESTAIYSEEAKRPARTVPRATYLAVAFLALFYGFITWVATAALGVDGLEKYARSADFQNLYFMLADSYLGPWAKVTMDVLMLTSIFAATLAFHNATSRYMFALGRDGMLPRSFARIHPRFASPYLASFMVSGGSVLLILVTLVLGGDPYLQLLLWTNGVGIVGIVFLQALCMLAVIRFFWRDRRGHSPFRVFVAPALGGLGLAVGLWLMLTNFDLLTAMSGWINLALVGPLFALGAVGVWWALRLRRREPEAYRRLGRSEEPGEAPSA